MSYAQTGTGDFVQKGGVEGNGFHGGEDFSTVLDEMYKSGYNPPKILKQNSGRNDKWELLVHGL